MAGRYQKQSGGTLFARNVAIVCALGALSFVLGFFVLAKLLPTGVAPVSEKNTTPQTASVVTSTSVTPTPPPAVPDKPSSTPTPSSKPAAGPLLVTEDPNAQPLSEEVKPIQDKATPTQSVTDAQPDPARDTTLAKPDDTKKTETTEPKPTDVKSSEKNVPTDSPNLSTPKGRRHKKSRQALLPATATDPTEPKRDEAETKLSKSGDTPSENREKNSRKTTTLAKTAEITPTETTRADVTADPTTNPRSTVKRLYRVQVNAYSTEVAAQHELDSLADRHIKAHIRKIVREGKTLYSVQYGAYRNREQAQAAQGKLKDQGVDSYVSQR